jgi:hypothetical protein
LTFLGVCLLATDNYSIKPGSFELALLPKLQSRVGPARSLESG